MQEHPIQGLMSTAMENIRDMVDVNTIVGDAVQCPDGSVIIPISKVSFGFAAGGGEYGSGEDQKDKGMPFAGGSGAGISINPMAFMVVGKGQVKLLPINAPGDRALEMVANVADKMADWVKGRFPNDDEDSGSDSRNDSRKESKMESKTSDQSEKHFSYKPRTKQHKHSKRQDDEYEERDVDAEQVRRTRMDPDEEL